MNTPYDGDRDPAGQMPHSPDPQGTPPDPYLQNTYAYDPYQQQDPAQWQQQPQAGYPQQEQQPGQEYDAYAHLFRDQRQDPPQQDYQQPYPQQDAGYQQPYQGSAPQDYQQGYAPQGGYPP